MIYPTLLFIVYFLVGALIAFGFWQTARPYGQSEELFILLTPLWWPLLLLLCAGLLFYNLYRDSI